MSDLPPYAALLKLTTEVDPTGGSPLFVMPGHDGVLDPQGKAIHHALEGLGFSGIADVRAGKLIELDLADETSESDIEAMCRKLLANTVIEKYEIELSK